MRTLAGLVVVLGCHVDHQQPPPDTGDVLTIKSLQNPDLDLLFVVDDSPSMADKQQAFIQTLPLFLGQLDSIDGGRPNLHVGIASTDMGTKASDNPTPAPAIGSGPGACIGFGKAGVLQVVGATLGVNNFVADARDGTKNYTGQLVDTLTPMLRLGELGCGFEQPLAAMRAALDANPMNPGFLRASANLAVIVLSDEDDCSVRDTAIFSQDPSLGPLESYRCFKQGVRCTPDDPTTPGSRSSCAPRVPAMLVDDIAPFSDFLLGLKGHDPRRLAFGAVVGDPAPVAIELRTPSGGNTPLPELAHSCTYDVGGGMAVADPAVRIAALASTFTGQSRVESVCSADLAPALGALGKSIKQLVGDTCLAQPIPDASATEPGVQADCELVDIRDSAPDSPTIVPPCGDGECWELVADPTGCPDAQHLRLVVHRATPPADDSWSTLRCAIH